MSRRPTARLAVGSRGGELEQRDARRYKMTTTIELMTQSSTPRMMTMLMKCCVSIPSVDAPLLRAADEPFVLMPGGSDGRGGDGSGSSGEGGGGGAGFGGGGGPGSGDGDGDPGGSGGGGGPEGGTDGGHSKVMHRGPQSEQSLPTGHAPHVPRLTPSSQMPSDANDVPMPKRDTKQLSSQSKCQSCGPRDGLSRLPHGTTMGVSGEVSSGL